MKNMFKLFSTIFLTVLIIGCSDKPSSSLIEEQNEIASKSFNRTTLGQYSLVNFKVLDAKFEDKEKTTYVVQLSCDIDKPIYGRELKNIPVVYRFEKIDGKWECTQNTADVGDLY